MATQAQNTRNEDTFNKANQALDLANQANQSNVVSIKVSNVEAIVKADLKALDESSNGFSLLKVTFPKLSAEQAKQLTHDYKQALLIETGFTPMTSAKVKEHFDNGGSSLKAEQLQCNAVFKTFTNNRSLLVSASKLGINYQMIGKSALETMVKGLTVTDSKYDALKGIETAVKGLLKAYADLSMASIGLGDILTIQEFSQSIAERLVTEQLAIDAFNALKSGIEAKREQATDAYNDDTLAFIEAKQLELI